MYSMLNAYGVHCVLEGPPVCSWPVLIRFSRRQRKKAVAESLFKRDCAACAGVSQGILTHTSS